MGQYGTREWNRTILKDLIRVSPLQPVGYHGLGRASGIRTHIGRFGDADPSVERSLYWLAREESNLNSVVNSHPSYR
jgi:hypothetical protein